MTAMMHDGATSLVPLTLMWVAMMSAMMAPTVWPWLVTFGRIHAVSASALARIAAAFPFAVGYLAAWSGYAVLAAVAQTTIAHGAHGTLGAASAAAGGSILLVAGGFQFTPMKRACLTHCRNPLSFLLASWHDGPPSGFRLGLVHGVFCVGCCWALMATALTVGVESWWWMGVLAAVTFVEQVVPKGDALRVPLGIALCVAGFSRLLF